jgi:hypothetical protein
VTDGADAPEADAAFAGAAASEAAPAEAEAAESEALADLTAHEAPERGVEPAVAERRGRSAERAAGEHAEDAAVASARDRVFASGIGACGCLGGTRLDAALTLLVEAGGIGAELGARLACGNLYARFGEHGLDEIQIGGAVAGECQPGDGQSRVGGARIARGGLAVRSDRGGHVGARLVDATELEVDHVAARVDRERAFVGGAGIVPALEADQGVAPSLVVPGIVLADRQRGVGGPQRPEPVAVGEVDPRQLAVRCIEARIRRNRLLEAPDRLGGGTAARQRNPLEVRVERAVDVALAAEQRAQQDEEDERTEEPAHGAEDTRLSRRFYPTRSNASARRADGARDFATPSGELSS